MAPAAEIVQKRKRQSALVMDEWLAEFIKRTILKLPFSETVTILKAWGFLTESELQTFTFRYPKDVTATEVVRLCEAKNATVDHAAALDLVFNHAYSNKKSWTVYQMSKPSESENDLFDASEFKLQFKKSIHAVSKNVTLNFKQFGEALWIRIAWGTHNTRPNQYKATFAVYHSQTPYVFITGLGKACRPLMCQALVIAAKYSQIQEMELKSRCLESLKDIVFKRFNQPFSSHHSIPHEKALIPKIVDPRVIYENMREKDRVSHLTRETFGEGPLPKLELASYKLETMFRAESIMDGNLTAVNEPFRCVVKFSSPHLLEAIRSLAPAGIAEAPISTLLSCIPHKARNSFKITEKRGMHPTSSQTTNF
ncbi:centromere protein N-A [Xenopus laevis]|nr:centromere protein N-A [Xenopus laevis]AAH84246.1 Cenpn-a protein [Xenopus laevis]